ncbi:alpha/beta hydrolase [Phyllobacterium leguminum]|uniref:Acetyl esterase n=1 Tax=Phyllobacterium leguminum TaxID=314237 RepID=A0A318T691_9HYPH|nr:alpha/beta hydrolase [Phyllobacterium leguminum]PYE87861.1 acetyl esterase [Phyllobacterium leguminum]
MTEPLPKPDPFMAPILHRMRAKPEISLEAISLREARAGFAAMNEQWNTPVTIAVRTVRDLSVPGAAGPLRARIYCDGDGTQAMPVIIYVHGGGWVLGSIDTHDDLLRRLAKAANGCAVLGIDYRLAPEHPFPAPLEDVLAAVRFVAGGGLGAGFDAGRIALAGESAGANLVLGALLDQRDKGQRPVRTAALFFGCYGLDFGSYSYTHFGDGSFGLSLPSMRWFWAQYLDKASVGPLAAPLQADLDGLPPLYLGAGGLDPLLDDTLTLSRRLAETGVAHRLDFHPGVIHGFIQMARELPAATQAIDASVQFMMQGLQLGDA